MGNHFPPFYIFGYCNVRDFITTPRFWKFLGEFDDYEVAHSIYKVVDNWCLTLSISDLASDECRGEDMEYKTIIVSRNQNIILARNCEYMEETDDEMEEIYKNMKNLRYDEINHLYSKPTDPFILASHNQPCGYSVEKFMKETNAEDGDFLWELYELSHGDETESYACSFRKNVILSIERVDGYEEKPYLQALAAFAKNIDRDDKNYEIFEWLKDRSYVFTSKILEERAVESSGYCGNVSDCDDCMNRIKNELEEEEEEIEIEKEEEIEIEKEEEIEIESESEFEIESESEFEIESESESEFEIESEDYLAY